MRATPWREGSLRLCLLLLPACTGAVTSREASDAAVHDTPDSGHGSAGDAASAGDGAASVNPDGGGDAANPGADAAVTPVGTPVFVAVGYAGRRMRSLDLGETWTDDVELGGGGDDEFLLRSVTFEKGRFVAAGFKILTSPSGAGDSWEPLQNPVNQWIGSLTFGNGRFVGVGGYGTSWYSLDGLAWQLGGRLDEEASRELVFGNGKFVSWTDPGQHFWSSDDGEQWTRQDGDHTSGVALCDGQIRDRSDCTGILVGRGFAAGGGVFVRTNEGGLQRSVDGMSFDTVVDEGPGFEDVAFGYVAEE